MIEKTTTSRLHCSKLQVIISVKSGEGEGLLKSPHGPSCVCVELTDFPQTCPDIWTQPENNPPWIMSVCRDFHSDLFLCVFESKSRSLLQHHMTSQRLIKKTLRMGRFMKHKWGSYPDFSQQLSDNVQSRDSRRRGEGSPREAFTCRNNPSDEFTYSSLFGNCWLCIKKWILKICSRVLQFFLWICWSHWFIRNILSFITTAACLHPVLCWSPSPWKNKHFTFFRHRSLKYRWHSF